MKNLAQYKALFEKELFENVIPFWTKNAIDEVNGGIYNSLDRQGEIYSTDKSVWMQGRAAYMFSYIYNGLKKDPEYLAMAKSCLDFIKTSALLTYGNNVTCAEQVRSNINSLAVNFKVAMANKLSCFCS